MSRASACSAGVMSVVGKSLIIGDNKTADRELIFRAHGRFVESLGGRYITAEDVGTSTADMDYVHMETDYVSGLAGRSGDPSRVTAHGVFRAIQASAKERWGSDDISGRTITIQGCVTECGARAVGTDEIYSVAADVFAPCALGAIINDKTIPMLKVEVVAGAANNVLLEERHGDELERKNILYAPDYVANAGGVINVYSELAGWTSARALRKADEIYDTVLKVFAIAKADRIPTYVAADRLAEQRIKSVGSMVRTWPQWPNK